jgi:hypothetical protein
LSIKFSKLFDNVDELGNLVQKDTSCTISALLKDSTQKRKLILGARQLVSKHFDFQANSLSFVTFNSYSPLFWFPAIADPLAAKLF